MKSLEMKRILLLGGVTEALAIARTLGPQHIYSLAGIGRIPTDLTCQVRVGGYGGAEGLAQFIRAEGIDLLLDATHPYAAQISHNAAQAARACAIPCWALRRPAWQPQAGDDWREVADWAELIQALQPFHRPLFTLGRAPCNICMKFRPSNSGPCVPWTLTPVMSAAKSLELVGRFTLRASASCSNGDRSMCW